MPTLKNRVPKYRKHKASGRAVVTLSGRDHYLGIYGTAASRREYERLVGEWLAAGRQSSHVTRETFTVAMLMARYLIFAKAYYRKGGELTSEFEGIKLVLRQLKAPYGATIAADFGPLALKAIQQRLIDQGWKRSTINQAINRIRRMFKWGVSEQLIPQATHGALATVPGLRSGKSKAVDAEPVRPVAVEVVDATLEQLPDVVADMVRFQRLTGTRPAEVCGLRPCDVDRTGDVWLYRVTGHKTEHHGRERIVYIGPNAQGILLRYLARDAKAFCFQPRDSEAKRRAEAHAERKTPLSCGNKPGSAKARQPKRRPGKRYSVESYGRAVRRASQKAFPIPEGMKGKELAEFVAHYHWSPNRLRHSFATAVRASHGLEGAQVLLGHSQADITQIYAERDENKAISIIREVG